MIEANTSTHSSALEWVLTDLRCPACHARLSLPALNCETCRMEYGGGVLPIFLSPTEQATMKQSLESDGDNAFKNFFKRWPLFYEGLSFMVACTLNIGLTGRQFVKRFHGDERMLNVGSGPTKLHPNVVNLDVYPFRNVDLIAAAERLPFQDGTFDVVMSDQVLEHVPDAQRVAAEIVRVTRVGGHIYIGVPFMYPLHPSPKDYLRLSVDGIASFLPGCEVVQSGISFGPTSGMLIVLAAWLAVVFSLGIVPLRKVLYYCFMLVLSPLKYLDLLLGRLPGADAVAGGVYVVAVKRKMT